MQERFYGESNQFLYEYLEHTADIQIHSAGESLEISFCNMAYGLIGYMIDLSTVTNSIKKRIDISASCIEGMLHGFLEEVLFLFQGDIFITKSIDILTFDVDNMKIKADCWGEYLETRHCPQGEIKAVTFCNIEVNRSNPFDLFVIVDV
jgi:SHS2 domain-containing protein